MITLILLTENKVINFEHRRKVQDVVHFLLVIHQYLWFNPLPVQFKSLLHGQERCIFFSGNLIARKYQYVLVLLGQQAAFKSSTL
jgi:hypothetical protein